MIHAGNSVINLGSTFTTLVLSILDYFSRIVVGPQMLFITQSCHKSPPGFGPLINSSTASGSGNTGGMIGPSYL